MNRQQTGVKILALAGERGKWPRKIEPEEGELLLARKYLGSQFGLLAKPRVAMYFVQRGKHMVVHFRPPPFRSSPLPEYHFSKGTETVTRRQNGDIWPKLERRKEGAILHLSEPPP